jgi:hypothetical protein
VLACDFFVAVTATFRMVYGFVVLDVGTRRITHWNTTEYPTAEWTAQQFRMIVAGDDAHRYVIHDRDSIYSEGVDRTLAAMGLTGSPNACSGAAGERILRAPCGNHSPRVFGLPDSADRIAPAPNHEPMGGALQRRFILPHLAMW